MKKIFLTGVISVSLVLMLIIPVFADETVQVSTQAKLKVGVGTKDTNAKLEVQAQAGATDTNAKLEVQAQAGATDTQAKAGAEAQIQLQAQNATLDGCIEAAVVKGIDPKVVSSLKEKGFGYGKIAQIAGLAEKSGKTIDEVVKALGENKSMVKLAKSLNLKLRDVIEVQRDIGKKVKEGEKQFRLNAQKKIANIDVKVIESLREKGFGYGEIALTVGLAEKSGKTIDEVVKVLEEKHGFGKIAKELGIKISDVIKVKVQADKIGIQIEKEKKEEVKKEELKKEELKKKELKKDQNKIKEQK